MLTPRPEAPVSPNRARWAVTLVFFLHGLLFANWAARLPELEHHYGIEHRELGQVLFCNALGAWGAMPLASWLLPRFGSRRLTTIGALLFCAFIPGLALLDRVDHLMALFLALGAATGLLDVAMNSQAIQVEQRYPRPIMSSFHAAFSLGGMLGAGAGALGAHLHWSYATHLLSFSAVSLLLVGAAATQLLPVEQAVSETNEAAATPAGFRWPSRLVVGLGIVAFCCMLGEGAMADWSTIYLVQDTHASAALAPLGYAAFSLAMATGRVLGDAAALRFGAQRLVVAGGLLALVGLLGLLLVPLPAVGIGGLALIGLGLSTVIPTVFSATGQQSDMAPAAALGLVSTIGYGGFLLGPPVIGWLADALTLRWALGIVATLFVVLVGVGLTLRLTSRVRAAHLEPVLVG
ncbi:MFS transporter [Hymenobacter chitinivorans]|uniref:Fucose permease n=1 Tax=Hymenobacter chitinivorans DSM 11115 TaxID=1121954 RepID=A0A2M9B493_9BACT|nr:MFS transporter [Hymenobacter chitinivorans]PJJ52762.1 fucose permease [Hymenobacter chitinivorans DSM 11115]